MPTFAQSTSVKERILANIKTTLEGITVAGGYGNTVLNVSRYENNPHNEGSLPALGIVGVREDFVTIEGNPPRYNVELFVTITGIVAHEPVGDSETKQNLLIRDIIAALMVDRKRSNLARDTKVTGTELSILEVEKPYSVSSVILSIQYQMSATDPTQHY